MLKTTKIPRLIYSSRNCSRIEYRTAKSTPTNVVAKSAILRRNVKAGSPDQTVERTANATIENRNLFARRKRQGFPVFGDKAQCDNRIQQHPEQPHCWRAICGRLRVRAIHQHCLKGSSGHKQDEHGGRILKKLSWNSHESTFRETEIRILLLSVVTCYAIPGR